MSDTATQVNLSDYDFELFIDKSASMSETDCPGGKTRWKSAQEDTENIARECAKYDSDGITVTMFSNTWKTYESTTPDKVHQIFTENSPGGNTDTAGALKSRLDAYFARKKAGNAKPVIFVVITDGEPNDQDALEAVIVNAANHVDKDEEMGIEFLQIGKNQAAATYLKHLDNGLSKKAKFDIVNTKTFEELANVGVLEALLASIND